MKRSLIALGLAVTLATVGAGAAGAQSTTATMDIGLTMVELAAGNALRKLGLADVDLRALTLHELAQIRSVFADRDHTATERAEQVRRIIEAN